MTTFTTTITAMNTLQQPDPNYIVTIFWEVTGVDGSHIAYADGITQFDSSEQTAPFIPYNQLTEAIVIGWIPANQIEMAQATVQGQINSLITPPVVQEDTPLPWSA
jgi:hypothetical protein